MSEIKPCPETFEQAAERALMDGSVARAMEVLADEYDAGGANYIDVAAMREASIGLKTLVDSVNDLTASLNRASDACASVQKERDELREKHDHLEHIIDRDRYIVAHGLQAIKKVLSGYDWLSEGRGSYEFDDERYQKEFGDALDAIRGSLKTLECLAFDKAHCTTDPNKVHAARHGALAFLARYEGGRKS